MESWWRMLLTKCHASRWRQFCSPSTSQLWTSSVWMLKALNSMYWGHCHKVAETQSTFELWQLNTSMEWKTSIKITWRRKDTICQQDYIFTNQTSPSMWMTSFLFKIHKQYNWMFVVIFNSLDSLLVLRYFLIHPSFEMFTSRIHQQLAAEALTPTFPCFKF